MWCGSRDSRVYLRCSSSWCFTSVALARSRWVWQKQHTNGGREEEKKRQNKINFWFLFIIFSLLFLLRCGGAHPWNLVLKLTTKTIMDPLIGFLDCVLVSFLFIILSREGRKKKLFVFPSGECSMILTFR